MMKMLVQTKTEIKKLLYDKTATFMQQKLCNYN